MLDMSFVVVVLVVEAAIRSVSDLMRLALQ